jgi:hypothetical protein
VGGGIIVGMWPAELKRQADHLYADGRGKRMVLAARERGWTAHANPHLAFFNSHPRVRLYMAPQIDPSVYAEGWEGPDGRRIGEHSRDEVVRHLWPWLIQRGYASEEDDEALGEFLSILGRRKAHLRPGMPFRRRWGATELERAGEKGLAKAVRADVNAILGAAGEPPLPG